MALPVVPIDIEGLDAEAFWRKARRGGPQDCWLWTDRRTSSGYGQFCVGAKRRVSAHRVAYELLVGPIPAGLVIDHLCRNRACINPAHMEPVTPQENTLRGSSVQAANAQKTHCVRGHPLTGDNMRRDRAGRRICRACKRESCRARRAK